MSSVTYVCLALTLVKVASAVGIAALLGVTMQVRLWHQVVPTLWFGTDRTTFGVIVGWLTVATALVALAGLLVLGLHSRAVVRSIAWAAGILSIFELIVAEAVLGALDPPRIPTLHLLVTTAICMTGVAIAFTALARPRNNFMARLRQTFEDPRPESVRFGPA